jgi:WhiB family redox-sensing transcriptional regulator
VLPAVRSLADPVPHVGRAPLPMPARSGRGEPAVRRSDPPRGRASRADLSWRRSAACLGHDISLFFPGSDPSPDPEPEPAEAEQELAEADDAARITRAKAVCATCPVRPRCLQHALEHREQHGIWGGTTETERRRILRRRRRRTTGAG